LVRLLFGIAAALCVGFLVAAGTIVFGAGMFWLFVFGDDPWPSWSDAALLSAGCAAGLASGTGLLLLVTRGARTRS
jgi:hypothetical protein